MNIQLNFHYFFRAKQEEKRKKEEEKRLKEEEKQKEEEEKVSLSTSSLLQHFLVYQILYSIVHTDCSGKDQ